MHIVFQKEDLNTLDKSFDLDESLRDDIYEIRDDYAVGPLENIYSDEGIEARKNWWRDVLAGNDAAITVDSGYVDDQKIVDEIKNRLSENENEHAWIWIGPNKHDVSGYYWLIAQLGGFAGRVFVLWLNNLPFINEKGSIFYPENLSEIPPREFLKAKKLARPVSASEFELDPDEWTRLSKENKTVRILEGAKKLSQHADDFFDKYILEYITADWQKANKVIQHFCNKAKHTTGDAYVYWRLRRLSELGKIDFTGEGKSRKDAEVKLKVGVEEEVEQRPE